MSDTNKTLIDSAPLIIRDYTDSDYEELVLNLQEGNLYSATWDARDRLRNKIATRPGSILLASIGDQIVGNAYIVDDGWAAFIFRLSVRKQFRGQGIGKKLMQACEARLQERGYSEVAIFVDDEDLGLKNFYNNKLDYQPTKAYLCMCKTL